jgi:hypothetical protein
MSALVRAGTTRVPIEQPESFGDLLTDVLRGDSNATMGTREAVG